MKNNLPAKQSNFLIYTGNDGKVNVEVFLKDETVWLTQKAMAELFGVNIPAISKHLSNIFESGVIAKGSNSFHFGNSSNVVQYRIDFLSDFDKEIQRIKGGKCDYD